MENAYFISKSFNEALDKYIKNNHNGNLAVDDFNQIVLLLLIKIYGDLDFINPYITNDSKVIFNNMTKFNYDVLNVHEFFRELESYNLIANKNKLSGLNEPNPYFISVQKKLIDMYKCKSLFISLNDVEKQEFYNLLFTPGSKNAFQISFNNEMAKDINEVSDYYFETFNEPETTKEPAFAEDKPSELIVDYQNNSPEFIDEGVIDHSLKNFKRVQYSHGYVNIIVIVSVITVIIIGAILINAIVG